MRSVLECDAEFVSLQLETRSGDATLMTNRRRKAIAALWILRGRTMCVPLDERIEHQTNPHG